MENHTPLINGTAVVVDVVNFTKLTEKKELYDKFLIIQYLSESINYIMSQTNGRIVHFTGDGAMLFFEEKVTMCSSFEAMAFAISLCRWWEFCKNIIDILKDFKIRVCLDKGQVITNSEGGLWIGDCLNKASHMHGEAGRVTISNNVYESLNGSFFHQVFAKVDDETYMDLHKIDKSIACYISSLPIQHSDWLIPIHDNKVSKVCCLVVGTGVDINRLEVTVDSLLKQSLQPQIIVAVTNKTLNSLKEIFIGKQISYTEILDYKAKNRSYVRNKLLGSLPAETELVCFVDGDVVLGSKCIEKAFNVYKSDSKIVFTPPRIELDIAISDDKIYHLYEMFLKTNTNFINISPLYFNKQDTKYFTNITFLPSYCLYVPFWLVKINNCWDENFEGYGEEDIDYTYRLFLKGAKLSNIQDNDFKVLHLNHKLRKDDLLAYTKNMQYLLSKFPEIYEYRENFYVFWGNCIKWR